MGAWRSNFVLAAVCWIGLGGPGWARGIQPTVSVGSDLQVDVLAAVQAAHTRMGRPECAAVFADFTDGEGRRLDSVLAERAPSGPAYLAGLIFKDGGEHPACRAHRGTMAFTSPNGRDVFLCTNRFVAMKRADPELATSLLIHETLHTLGLRENPPTSREITTQVQRRCSR